MRASLLYENSSRSKPRQVHNPDALRMRTSGANAQGAPLLAVPSPKKLMLTWLADSSFNALCGAGTAQVSRYWTDAWQAGDSTV